MKDMHFALGMESGRRIGSSVVCPCMQTWLFLVYRAGKGKRLKWQEVAAGCLAVRSGLHFAFY
jgi:hypothetical protein